MLSVCSYNKYYKSNKEKLCEYNILKEIQDFIICRLLFIVDTVSNSAQAIIRYWLVTRSYADARIVQVNGDREVPYQPDCVPTNCPRALHSTQLDRPR